jgi:CheY-like chemotaxis protein
LQARRRTSRPPETDDRSRRKNHRSNAGQYFQWRWHEAKPAYSAEQALEFIAEWGPAIAIVDAILPAMNGIDPGILLKASGPSI